MKKVSSDVRKEVSEIVKQHLGNFENKLVDGLVEYVQLFEGGERTKMMKLMTVLKTIGKDMCGHPEALPPEKAKEVKEIEKIHRMRMGRNKEKVDEKIKRRIESKFKTCKLYLKPFKRHKVEKEE